MAIETGGANRTMRHKRTQRDWYISQNDLKKPPKEEGTHQKLKKTSTPTLKDLIDTEGSTVIINKKGPIQYL